MRIFGRCPSVTIWTRAHVSTSIMFFFLCAHDDDVFAAAVTCCPPSGSSYSTKHAPNQKCVVTIIWQLIAVRWTDTHLARVKYWKYCACAFCNRFSGFRQPDIPAPCSYAISLKHNNTNTLSSYLFSAEFDSGCERPPVNSKHTSKFHTLRTWE